MGTNVRSGASAGHRVALLAVAALVCGSTASSSALAEQLVEPSSVPAQLAAPEPVTENDEQSPALDLLRDGLWELRFALGAGTDTPWETDYDVDGVLTLNYAITDRLQWALPFPAFSYRVGTAGLADVTGRAGLTGLGYSSVDGVIGRLDTGFTMRAWLARELALVLVGSLEWEFHTEREEGLPSRTDILLLRANLGFSWHVGDALTVSFAAGALDEALVRDSVATDFLRREVTFGALQAVGYRPLPLLQFHLSPTLSIDAYAAWGLSLRDTKDSARYLLGFGWIF